MLEREVRASLLIFISFIRVEVDRWRNTFLFSLSSIRDDCTVHNYYVLFKAISLLRKNKN